MVRGLRVVAACQRGGIEPERRGERARPGQAEAADVEQDRNRRRLVAVTDRDLAGVAPLNGSVVVLIMMLLGLVGKLWADRKY